jgi:hypothetical protein
MEVPLREKDTDETSPGVSCFGPVMSEQAVMTTEAMMPVAMRSWRRIIEVVTLC